MDKRIAYVVVAIAAAGIAVGALMGPDDGLTPETPTETSEVPTETSEPAIEQAIPQTVDVGVLLPATGDIASHGEDNIIASKFGAADFNAYLEETGEPWRLNLIIEDTQTDPIVALEKLQSLNAKGIKLILGTETSSELLNVKSYADSNGMLLISPSSTSPKLAIPDNLFRLIPDDTRQGKVIAELLAYDGVSVVVPIYRGDVWGEGLHDSVKTSFEEIGGTVDEGIRYNPEITVFSTEASLLSDTVAAHLEEYAPGEVAVLMIGFSEAVHLLNSASEYDTLRGVGWYGSDASANDDAITGDRIASEFAVDVGLVASQFTASKNEKFERVRDHLIAEIGSPPNNYAYSSYDSVWLLGLSIQETQTIDALTIADALPTTAESYTGAIGQISFNEAGDLKIADYEMYTVTDGEWVAYGYYDSALNTITIY